MANPGHVYFTDPKTPVSQREKDDAAAAAEEIRKVLPPILKRYGAVALIDALISLWLDFQLGTFGVTTADRSLRELRRDLSKIAATRRAMNAESKGRPDA